MRGLRVLSVLLLVCGVAQIPASAQEASPAPSFILVSESTIAPEDAGDWAAAVATTARAHAEHPQGNLFATYRQLTGGPSEVVRVLFPFDRMGDLDAWTSNRQVLFETLGEERGRLVLDDLALAGEPVERVLSFSEKLSRPREMTSAPNYLWVVEVQVADGRMEEYAALARRVKDAYDASGSSRFWLTYGNALGGSRSGLTYLYGFDKFAALDGWPAWSVVLAEALGAEEGARLAAALESLATTRTSLWALEDQLSQMVLDE